jgi:hypothetical protein
MTAGRMARGGMLKVCPLLASFNRDSRQNNTAEAPPHGLPPPPKKPHAKAHRASFSVVPTIQALLEGALQCVLTHGKHVCVTTTPHRAGCNKLSTVQHCVRVQRHVHPTPHVTPYPHMWRGRDSGHRLEGHRNASADG